MDHGLEYAESVNPNPWSVLGLRLQPFSIGHKLLLDRIRSRVIYAEKVNVDDIALASLICSKPYEKAKAFLNSKFSTEYLKQWPFRAVAWMRHDYATFCLCVLRAYMDEAMSYRPKVWMDAQKSQPAVLPEALLLRITFLTKFNYSDSEVMNMPYRQALAEYYASLEREGLLRYRDPSKEDFFKRIQERQKAMLQ